MLMEALINLVKLFRRRAVIAGKRRSQPRQPLRFLNSIAARRRMTEKVDVKGTFGELPGLFNKRLRLRNRRRAEPKRSQSPGIAYRRSQGRRRHARHRRLNNRVTNIKQLH